MRNNSIVFLLLIFLLGSCKNEDSKKVSLLEIVPEKDTIYFKAKNLGDTSNLSLNLKNNSSKTIEIVNARGSCGCTKIAYKGASMLPKSQKKITVSYEHSGIVTPSALKNIVFETNSELSRFVVVFLKEIN